MQNTMAYHISSTKASTALYTPQANIGTLNFLNGYNLKDSSNLNQSHHTLPSTTNTINGWLRLLFFVDDIILYAGSNDAINKEFEDTVRNRFDVIFLGLAQ
jgi:hypothetical protein